MTGRQSAGWLAMGGALLLAGCAGSGEMAGVQPTLDALSTDGPYEVASYTDLPEVPEYGAATIYYPTDAAGPVGGVAIAPGFTERQSHIEWWGPRLASHGYAVMTLDTNTPSDRPEVRAEALIAAIGVIRGENSRSGSPLFGRVDVDRMAVMGHSMGGGGALLAANAMGDEIQASIPFTSWQPAGVFDRTTAPTLVIAGSADAVAPADQHAWPHFQSLPASTPRVYMEVDGGGHFIADTNRGEDLGMIGRYAIAWLKLYLDGDERYRGFIYGEEQRVDEGKFSRYVAHP